MPPPTSPPTVPSTSSTSASSATSAPATLPASSTAASAASTPPTLPLRPSTSTPSTAQAASPPRTLPTGEALARVSRGRVLAELDHPFLPTLYARLDASHHACFLIDYFPGGDLHSLLRRSPGHRLPPHAVLFYAAEVLLALEYLHALGFVYRDLKPETAMSCFPTSTSASSPTSPPLSTAASGGGPAPARASSAASVGPNI